VCGVQGDKTDSDGNVALFAGRAMKAPLDPDSLPAVFELNATMTALVTQVQEVRDGEECQPNLAQVRLALAWAVALAASARRSVSVVRLFVSVFVSVCVPFVGCGCEGYVKLQRDWSGVVRVRCCM